MTRSRWTAALLSAALWAALWAAPSAALAAEQDSSASPMDPDLQNEVAKADASNLENAAEGGWEDAGKAVRLVSALMMHADAGMEEARAEVSAVSRAPEPPQGIQDVEESLQMTAQMLPAKSVDFDVKAASASLGLPDEDRAKLLASRSTYNSKNRAADLRRARVEAGKAADKLGSQELSPKETALLASLESYVAELKDGLGQIERALTLLDPKDGRTARAAAPREPLLARQRSLQTDLEDLRQETGLLRSGLLLHRLQTRLDSVPTGDKKQ